MRRTTSRVTPGADEWRLFAIAAPGLEEVVTDEVRRLAGARAVTRVEGGVAFTGTTEVLWRANLELRTATRVLARLGEVRARDFPRLQRGVAALPWPRVFGGPRAVTVSVTTHRCRLYHTGAIAERLLLALGSALGAGAVAPAGGGAPPLAIHVRGVGDRFTVSADASGELLHRRGWRTEAGPAPLRETLAAGLLALAGWEPSVPLVDPMCGAGTIVLEACGRALGRPPGIGRGFAFEAWPGFDPARYRTLVEALGASGTAAPAAPLLGFDHDPAAVAVARRNAARAGFAGHVAFATAPLGELQPPPGLDPGLLLCNPPYGRRLGRRRDLTALYATLGRVLRERFRDWQAGILTSDPALARATRLRPCAEHALSNGGLRVRLYVYDLRRRRSP